MLCTYIFFFNPFFPPLDRPLFLPTAIVIWLSDPEKPEYQQNYLKEIESEYSTAFPTWFEKGRYRHALTQWRKGVLQDVMRMRNKL
jgi:hypothetical protein